MLTIIPESWWVWSKKSDCCHLMKDADAKVSWIPHEFILFVSDDTNAIFCHVASVRTFHQNRTSYLSPHLGSGCVTNWYAMLDLPKQVWTCKEFCWFHIGYQGYGRVALLPSFTVAVRFRRKNCSIQRECTSFHWSIAQQTSQPGFGFGFLDFRSCWHTNMPRATKQLSDAKTGVSEFWNFAFREKSRLCLEKRHPKESSVAWRSSHMQHQRTQIPLGEKNEIPVFLSLQRIPPTVHLGKPWSMLNFRSSDKTVSGRFEQLCVSNTPEQITTQQRTESDKNSVVFECQNISPHTAMIRDPLWYQWCVNYIIVRSVINQIETAR